MSEIGPPPRPHCELDETEEQLYKALIAWRDERALKIFGWGVFNTLGGRLFMTEYTIDEIIVCARTGKIVDVGSVKREMGWPYEGQGFEGHDESLLEVVHGYYPPSPEALVEKKLAGQRLCSSCGQAGHNRTACLKSNGN